MPAIAFLRGAAPVMVLAVGVLVAGGAEAAAPEGCRTVRFGDVGWTDIAATTGAATAVLQRLGYETTVTISSVPITFLGLKTRSIDVFLGNWMPTMESMIAPFTEEGSIEVVGANLEGAKYTLAVPSYAAEGGLRDFADIARFKDALEGKIYAIEPGNDGNLLIDKMIKEDAFGLGDFEMVESSEAGMLGEVRRAVRRGEWIVFLGWEPHPMNTDIKMTYLSGGDDYFGPDLGGATVYTNVRKGYLEECPNVGRFLQNLEFSLDMENEIMKSILDEEEEPQAAAEAWIARHPETLERWLDGVTTVEGEPGLPAVKGELGL
jgi:glycine betaine/proline transport system substrate-binding protein